MYVAKLHTRVKELMKSACNKIHHTMWNVLFS